MKLMSTHIKQPGMADSLADVLKAEINQTAGEVFTRSDWLNRDIEQCNAALAKEASRTIGLPSYPKDSVKAEDSLKLVYQYTKASTDTITLLPAGILSLAECKYGIKLGGSGPFRSPVVFVRDIAKKFDKVEKLLSNDVEAVRRLRILVVSYDQLPYTIANIKALKQLSLPAGSFSTDGQEHMYVVCSTTEVRQLLGSINLAGLTPGSYHFFKI